jgi:hypothetical protein
VEIVCRNHKGGEVELIVFVEALVALYVAADIFAGDCEVSTKPMSVVSMKE